MEQGLDVLLKFVDHGVKQILSDGDLDGIVATGLLRRFLLSQGVDIQAVFPHPSELDTLTATNAILVELPPTKGILYCGQNVLIDHHDEFSGVFLLHGERVVDGFSIDPTGHCASTIVNYMTGLYIEMSDLGLRILDAITEIDSGRCESSLSECLHKAYRLNVQDAEIRYDVCGWVSSLEWHRIAEWADTACERWAGVEDTVQLLMERARNLTGLCVYFTYMAGNSKQIVAMREAMLRLEKVHDIVLAMAECDEDGEPVIAHASIGTMQDGIDLRPLFREIRKKVGVTAGGRKNVGGIQFSPRLKLMDVISLIKKILIELE